MSEEGQLGCNDGTESNPFRGVSGTVRRTDGSFVEGALVRAFLRQLREEEAIGKAGTDECGRFHISHHSDDPASLVVRVYDAAGAVVYESDPLFRAHGEVMLDIAVPVAFAGRKTELERVLAAIKPYVGKVAADALTQADIGFLSKAADLPVDLLLALRLAAGLEKQAGLPLPPFYGLLRIGRGHGLRDLLLLSNDELRTDINRAGRELYIPPVDRRTVDQILARFDELRKNPRYQLAWIWVARLIDDGSGKAIAGAEVRASDPSGDGDPTSAVTAADGVFSIQFAATVPTDGKPRTKHLEITLGQGTVPMDVQINPGAAQTQEVRVTIPPPPPPPSPRLDSLPELGAVPKSLIAALAELGIETMDGLQGAGNLADLPGIRKEDPAVIRLQAHADLGRISADVALNSFLIDQGFLNAHAIANATEAQFVNAVADRAGDFGAAALHGKATVHTHFVANVVQDALAAPPASLPDYVVNAVKRYAKTYRCDCEECQMAISPLAYLADLLDYAVRHLKVSGAAIDLPFLVNTFYQPFDKLPASCDSLDKLVRQVRICVEVLRRYIADKPPTPAQAAALLTAESDYREAAWEALLVNIGTNSEEVRAAVAASGTVRQALADKIGIDIGTPRPDSLDALVLTGGGLTEAALEALFGLVDTTRDPLAPGATPQLQTWRTDHLRTIWKTEDWPSDYHGTGLPMVDPDVIGPDDFRSPVAKPVPAAPDQAFDLWIKRREWVDAQLAAFAAITKVVGGTSVPDLDALFTSMYSAITYDATSLQPWAATTKPADFDAVALDLTGGVTETVTAAAADRIRKDLALQPGEFLRLLALRNKDNAAADPRNQPVQTSEWQEVFSILAEAAKRTFFPAWIAEEKADTIELGPATFWPITREPVSGAWPPLAAPVLIDPDLTALPDLPDPTAGQRAIGFWRARQTQLEKLRADLEAKRKASGLDAELLMALGDPSPGNPLPVNIATLASNLANNVSIPATTAAIENQLFMSVPDFLVMMSIKAKDSDPSPLAKPVESDWETLNAILAAASKRKRLYPVWSAEETAAATGVTYWQALRAKFPPWRAPAGERESWTTALKASLTPPLIDPDLIGPADMVHPILGDAAFNLWKARRGAVDSEIAALEAIRLGAASDLAGFDAMVLSALLVEGKEITAIRVLAETGTRVSPRLLQLGLTFNSFNMLSSVRELATGAATILDTEWTQVKSILAQVWKTRLFPAWRLEEKSAGVLLSSEWFQNSAAAAGSATLPPGITLTPWLADPESRRDWVDHLQTRLDQDAAVVEEVTQAADAAEGATLAPLRDALVLASAAAGADLETKATWVTLHLAIDAEESTCHKTTRVAQAIETLQDVIFSVRAHDPGEVFPDLILDANHFDEEWTWLGSYSTWRSAMLVFMYPENVAAPTLKPAQTPAFRTLVAEVEGNAQLDPRAACEAASRYSIYFQDICTLFVPASCYGYSRLRTQNRCAGVASDDWHMLIYMFGQGSASQNVYWSTWDWKNTTGQAQTFWAALPGLDGHNVDRVAGATPFYTASARTFAYVFMRGNKDGRSTLLFERIPTDTQIPEGVAWALDIPDGWGSFEIAVVQRGGSTPPRIGLTLSNGEVWERDMDPTGMRWGPVDWRRLNRWMDWGPISDRKVRSNPKHPPVGALARFSNHLDVFWVDDDNGKIFTTWADERVNNFQWTTPYQIGTLTTATACGVVTLARNPDHIDLFTIGDDGSVFSNWWDYNIDGGMWHDWFRIGPAGIADTRSQIAAVCQSPTHIDLFVIGPDQGLWSTWWDANPANGQWPPWFPIGDRGMNTRYDVSACSRTNGRLDVFTILGDGQVLTTHWDANPANGQWPNWAPLNGQPATYSDCCPAIARKPDHIDLFVFDINSQVSHAFWDQNVNGGNWSLWNVVTPLTTGSSFASPVAAISRFPDQLDVFFLYTDGVGRTSVQSTWWNAGLDGGSWHPFFTIGSFLATNQHSFPVVSADLNRMDLFVIGKDQKIYTSWFQSADWYTQKPNPLPPVWIRPFDIGPYSVTNDLPSSSLQIRRLFEEFNFIVNLAAPDYISEYMREAYFFAPMFLGMQLANRGFYQAALDWYRTTYDYGAPVAVRKIYFGLVLEQFGVTTYKRGTDWLLDPLNPHRIARTRPNCYTRFTIQTIIKCFLDWADDEFSQDTPETVAKARTLYMAALELISLPDLVPPGEHCGDVLGTLEIDIGDGHWQWVWTWLLKQVATLQYKSTVAATVSKLKAAMSAATPLEDRMGEAQKIVAAALAAEPPKPTVAQTNDARSEALVRVSSALLAHAELRDAANEAADATVQDVQLNLAEALDVPPEQVPGASIPWLRKPVTPPAAGTLQAKPPKDTPGIATPSAPAFAIDPATFVPERPKPQAPLVPVSNYTSLISANLKASALIPKSGYIHWVPPPSFYFCVPANPILAALRSHIDLELYKIRHCMNIAGMSRQLEPYAAPTNLTSGLPAIGPSGAISLPASASFQPTLYRYATLIDRAKQLVQLAAQIEGSMLSALEQLAAEQYALIKARQDVQLAYAGVQLQTLRVQEAMDGVVLQQLQQQRAQIFASHYQDLLAAGISDQEQNQIDLLNQSAALQEVAAATNAAAALQAGFSVESFLKSGSGATALVASSLSALAGAFGAQAQVAGAMASFERRQQDWQLQAALGRQDERIGGQQIVIAQDQVRVTGQELTIARMTADNASAIADYLANKFTNAELFQWMSQILQGVYSFFLQQATVMASLAQNQLSFERQQVTPAFIQSDYWRVQSAGDPNSNQQDRRGLTGSARLLQDIYQLDQYAFQTDRRKLQLTKTFSLATLAPFEFQQLRETGVLRFATPMELFDRDFPGHYLRLIRQVKVTVIALIPPQMGIRATLLSGGLSRVVIDGTPPQTAVIRRPPESVAFSSALATNGLFDLQPANGMLLPFEGGGVDTAWEFRMARAANPWNFSSLADVLVSVDYTSLDSYDQRQRVLRTMSNRQSTVRAYNFRFDLEDAWFDLNNPDESATPMSVAFDTEAQDFPPNLSDLRIAQVLLYFSRADGTVFEIPVKKLAFTPAGTTNATGGAASTVDGCVSTLRGNGASWLAMIGKPPIGRWQLTLPNTEQMRSRFADGEIDNMLFMLTIEGSTPSWPA